MLSQPQRATLKAHILATPALNAYVADQVWTAIRDLLNQPASPDWTIWKTAVRQDEIMKNGMNWTRVDNLSVGKARIWEWLFRNSDNAIDPSKTNVRAGIDATWVGTQADLDVRAAVYVHCKRLATALEKLFSTGTGSASEPATLAIGSDGYVEGAITADEIQLAMTE